MFIGWFTQLNIVHRYHRLKFEFLMFTSIQHRFIFDYLVKRNPLLSSSILKGYQQLPLGIFII